MFRKFIKIKTLKHPFLYASIAISLILAIIPCLTFLIFAEHEKLYGLIFILPSILVILVSLFAFKTYDKKPILTKIISFFLNVSIILVLQIGYGSVIFFIFALCEADYEYNNIADYSKALESICYKEYTGHFPQKIPEKATNIVLYKTSSHWFGSEEIILKFKIDKEYIEKELSKYSYNYIETPKEREWRHGRFDYKLAMENYTLYIIHDSLSKKAPNIGPYEYGIAINSSTNEIAYYYMNPD